MVLDKLRNINAEFNALLLLAAQQRHQAIVEELLKNDTDVGVVNGAGDTPLSLAARKGHQAILPFHLKQRTFRIATAATREI
jgi:ankyrin repeat protein